MSKKSKKKDCLIEVRQSTVHGRGVFAKQDIPKGTQIIEYIGQVIDWDEALRRHPHDPSQPNHTFYFGLEDGCVIDAKYGGNEAMWINHSCKPNCQALEEDKITKKMKKEYACYCGHKKCRGTMLAEA